MKFLLLIATVALSGIALAASPSAEKLRQIPITVYPECELRESAVVPVFNALARADDVLVVSFTEAFKEAFRLADLGVTQGGVWIYTAQNASLNQTMRKNIEGVKGIVYVPDTYHDRHSPRQARSLHEEAKTMGLPLTVGVTFAGPTTFSGIAEMAPHGESLTIYANQVLRYGAKAYRKHVERAVAAARATNPKIKIEVAVAVAATPEANRQLLEVIRENLDVADRVGIFCDNSKASLEGLTQLVGGMRKS